MLKGKRQIPELQKVSGGVVALSSNGRMNEELLVEMGYTKF